MAIAVGLRTLAVLSQACRDGEQVRFDYADKDGVETRRLVEPYRLVPAGHRWYLSPLQRCSVAWIATRVTWSPSPAAPAGCG